MRRSVFQLNFALKELFPAYLATCIPHLHGVLGLSHDQPRRSHAGPRLDVRALVAFFALAYALS
jgi:hypothetical protein